MSDTKILNNQLEALNVRLDTVERARVELEDENKTLRQQLSTSRSEATYFRTECRTLAARGNAATAIQDNLARRLEAHKRDLIPGDRIHAAAIVELEAVLDVVAAIIGKGQA